MPKIINGTMHFLLRSGWALIAVIALGCKANTEFSRVRIKTNEHSRILAKRDTCYKRALEQVNSGVDPRSTALFSGECREQYEDALMKAYGTRDPWKVPRSGFRSACVDKKINTSAFMECTFGKQTIRIEM